MRALCRANLGILNQKLDIIKVMNTEFGKDQAKILYAQVCPIVQASIGQHIRHSMDHLELAVQVAATSSNSSENHQELHYDLRTRGGEDELDMEQAWKRIENVIPLLETISSSSSHGSSSRNVQAYFMLSGDPTEFQLPSTVEREMGFAAHHAIHHMAMVKIIALETLGIPKDALSSDFGRAPSTVVHDKL